jgi:hypothetical protein
MTHPEPTWLHRKRRRRKPTPMSDTDLDHPAPTHRYINVSSASQNATLLKPGTAAKGRVGFGDTIGERRMKAGDRLCKLADLSPEAIIATLEGDTREILLLNAHIRPL